MLKTWYNFGKNKVKGFTLIELLIVVAIIAILAAIAIPQFAAYRRRGYNSAAMSDLRNIRTTEEAMFADFQDYGSGTDDSVGGTLTLTGFHSSTVAQTVTPSNGVIARATTKDVSGKNNTFIAQTVHTAGDNAYGADSDSSAMYRHACGTAGACTTTDRDASIPTPTSGTDDLATLGIWVKM